MKISYRQGIVTSQTTAGVPDFIVKPTSGDYLTLYANHVSTIFTVAHGPYNYLYEEANTIESAWGPFTSGTHGTYYLYWDINMVTGLRTFGFTTLRPIVAQYAPRENLNVDQHWFDTSANIMRVYGTYGWDEVLRVFAGEYTDGHITVYRFESQANLNTEIHAGFILFDETSSPIIRRDKSFITTESNIFTTKSLISPIRFDSNVFYAKAIEDVPEYSVVYYYSNHQIAVASYDNELYAPAAGLIRTQTYTNEMTNVVSAGYITNIEWHFNKPPASPVYLGLHGNIQTTPPTKGFIQKIGTIVSADTILISIDPPIIFQTSATSAKNSIALTVDVESGALYTSQPYETLLGNPTDLPGNSAMPSDKIAGFTYKQLTPKTKWSLSHNLHSSDVFVQCYNELGVYIIPNIIQVIDNNNIVVWFTEPVKGTAQAVIFLDPAFITIPDVNVPTFEYLQNVPSTSWAINHDIGYIPITRVYINGIMVIPYSIVHTSVNQTIVTFMTPQVGTVRFV